MQGHTQGVYSLVYIPHDEDEEESEEEEKKHGNKKHKKLSKKKNKHKAKENESNQNQEVKLQPGDLVITGSADSNVKIWSLHSGECFHVRISFPIHV